MCLWHLSQEGHLLGWGSPPHSGSRAFCGTTFGCRELWGWCRGEQGRACPQDPQQSFSETKWEIMGQIRADFPMRSFGDFDNGLLPNMRTKANTLCSPCEDGLMCFSGKMLCLAGPHEGQRLFALLFSKCKTQLREG